jgi:hypothetical protein
MNKSLYSLKEYAGKFQQWLDLIEGKDTRIGKRDTLYSLVNLVFEVDFQRVLGWLERTRPAMFGPLKRALNSILSGVEIIYQTKDIRFGFKPPPGSWPKPHPNPLWFSKLHDKNVPHLCSGDTDFQELKERVLLFANLLEDTATDLQETKQPPEASEQKKEEKPKLKSKRRGRPPKYTKKFLQEVKAFFEQSYKETGHKQQSWQLAADEHNLTSGKAAEMACRRYLKKQNKKQN